MVRALFIDHDEANLMLFQDLCHEAGIDVVVVQCSTQVDATLIRIDPVDIAFLDLDIPYANGHETFSVLKDHPSTRDAKIVACTARAENRILAHDVGFDSFIVKPILVQVFIVMMQTIVDGDAIWQYW